MKPVRKVFLLVWIPIIFMVSLMLCAQVGKEYQWIRGVGCDYNVHIRTWGDVLPAIFLIISVSILLFWMCGFEDKNESHYDTKQ